MPKDVPFAAVAINGVGHAGILAAQMVALQDPEVKARLKALKEKMAAEVAGKEEILQNIGVENDLSRRA